MQVGNDDYDTYNFEWYMLTRFNELYILRFQNMKIDPQKYESFRQSWNKLWICHDEQIWYKSLKCTLMLGCKHGKVDQKNALVYYNHNLFGQRRKSSSKTLFKLDFFSWGPLLLYWKQMRKMKLRSLILIIKSDSQKRVIQHPPRIVLTIDVCFPRKINTHFKVKKAQLFVI